MVVPIIASKPESLKVTTCICGHNQFLVLALPDIKSGGACIKILSCSKCGVMVEINERSLVGTKKIFVDQGKFKHEFTNPDASYALDENGKRHFRLKCETGHIGTCLNN